MRYILLPGFSPKNKDWADQLVQAFADAGIKLEVQDWQHWQTGSADFDVNAETDRFISNYQGEDVVVFAKSIGTRFVIELLRKHADKFAVQKLVLMGIPGVHDNYLQALDVFDKNNLTIVQNSNDPYLAFAQLADSFSDAHYSACLVEVEADTHDYPYPELFIEIAKQV